MQPLECNTFINNIQQSKACDYKFDGEMVRLNMIEGFDWLNELIQFKSMKQKKAL